MLSQKLHGLNRTPKSIIRSVNRRPKQRSGEHNLASEKIQKGNDQLEYQIRIIRLKQCCGSGSGSPCFWASQIRIHPSEVWIRIRILLSTCKNRKKNLNSYYFVTLFDLLSLKNDVNVPSKGDKQKKLC